MYTCVSYVLCVCVICGIFACVMQVKGRTQRNIIELWDNYKVIFETIAYLSEGRRCQDWHDFCTWLIRQFEYKRQSHKSQVQVLTSATPFISCYPHVYPCHACVLCDTIHAPEMRYMPIVCALNTQSGVGQRVGRRIKKTCLFPSLWRIVNHLYFFIVNRHLTEWL